MGYAPEEKYGLAKNTIIIILVALFMTFGLHALNYNPIPDWLYRLPQCVPIVWIESFGRSFMPRA
jgi:cbb3-type cytochrome oxidase subunit 1